jgi:hypothetical protein
MRVENLVICAIKEKKIALNLKKNTEYSIQKKTINYLLWRIYERRSISRILKKVNL